MGDITILTAIDNAFMGAVNFHGTTTCTRNIVMSVVNPGAGSMPPHAPMLKETHTLQLHIYYVRNIDLLALTANRDLIYMVLTYSLTH